MMGCDITTEDYVEVVGLKINTLQVAGNTTVPQCCETVEAITGATKEFVAL